MFPVSGEKERALLARMRALGVRPDELEERFVRSSGSGGTRAVDCPRGGRCAGNVTRCLATVIALAWTASWRGPAKT